MKKFNLIISLLMLTSFGAYAQSAGSILGKVLNENKKPLEGATVKVFDGGSVVGGDKTDALGRYEVKPLSTGVYKIEISYLGYVTDEITGIDVSNGKGTTVNSTMVVSKGKTAAGATIKTTRVVRPPLVDENKAGQPPGMTAKQIEKLSTNSTLSAAAMRPGTYVKKEGAALSLGGARTGNTTIMVDGVMVKDQSRVQLPKGSVEQVDVNVSGLPANLGDALGGVVQITTKGASARTTGSIDVQHSIDGYNNNQINANLRGPLLKLKDTLGNKTKTVLGYQLAAAGQYDVDDDPSFNGYYKLDPAKYEALYNQPMQLSPQGNGFVNSANFLRADDFIKIKARENAATRIASLQGKLIYSPSKYVTVTLGGNGIYNNSQGFSLANTLFSSQANAATQAITGRGYLRLRQNLDKNEGAKGLISKAYYIIQLGYEKNFSSTENAKHKKNVFDYAYLGRFQQLTQPIYSYDSIPTTDLKGLRFLLNAPAGMNFIPDYSYNPSLINYSQSILNISPFHRNVEAFQGNLGLVNGDVPNNVYGLYTNVGSQVNVYNKSESDQASINLDASFDIKPNYKKELATGKEVAKHAIEFGMYYDQRVSRNYGVSGVGNSGVWNLMRNVTNAHIELYDYNNPIFRHNGKDYTYEEWKATGLPLSGFDSVNYNRIYDGAAQSYFDKNLRKKLGLPVDGFDIINIDDLDHKLYTLDMFSPDDLLNGGQQTASWSGYDQLGNKTKGRASFEDFWKKKDANGNFTREIAPFNPIYVAGYIQDNFKFRDLRFRLGLRVDRFDANNKVLRDPYSLFATRKVSDLSTGQFSTTRDPNTGLFAPNPVTDADFRDKFKDHVVYVDDNASGSPRIIGYRNGDNWFDPFGNQVTNPVAEIKDKFGSGGVLAPYLQDPTIKINSVNYDVNKAFTDYKPRVNVSPRISFSFPIDSTSLFYAHYDVVYQRPSGGIFTTPDDYFFINEGNKQINNANLSPEKLVDYEAGFQQRLGANTAITISTFYKERKDQIQLQQITGAYPTTYTTFSNRDFSTAKGMTAFYEIRDIKKLPLNVNLSYTLQFAEGTGSSSTSQAALINSGQPGLRTILPMDFDSRHIMTLNADYRFGSAEGSQGPKIGKIYPFKNTGVNLTFRARSGEPYTRFTRAIPIGSGNNPISGSINGSRQPWNSNLDLRVDKDVILGKVGRKDQKEGDVVVKKGNRRPLAANVYAFAQNVLNTKNVLSVYGFTGNADDDGYVASPLGQLDAERQTDPTSWQDYYKLRLNNPSFFVNPRRIFVGINFNF